jgi:hypothetical protein
VVSFLRALERTGDVRASAEDAGIDYSTAYARRRRHADFAEAWDRALRAHKERKTEEEAEELEAFRQGPPSRFVRSPSPGELGEEWVAANGQVKRVGHGRWSRRKENIFFVELAATNNIKRSAKAAGVSYNAVLARRLKHPLFRAKWDAVAQCAKAGIGMYVLEASKKTFDPDTLDIEEATPKVTIAEAIRISQGAGSNKPGPAADPFEDEAYSYADEMDEIRERIVRKLQAMRRRDRPGLLAQGWSYDEEHDREVPPGWVKIGGEGDG